MMTADERKAAAARMRQIKREINKMARIARFMSKEQLAPYEAMAEEYQELRAKLAAAPLK